MSTRITRTSTRGLQVVYDSKLSAMAQLGISWNNGLGGGVAMSIQQAEDLQFLLSEVLRLAPPAIDPTKEKAAAAVEAQLLPWRDREPTPAQPDPPELTDEQLLEIRDGAYCPGVDEINDEDDSMWQYTSNYISWLYDQGTVEEQQQYEAKGLRAVFNAGRRTRLP